LPAAVLLLIVIALAVFFRRSEPARSPMATGQAAGTPAATMEGMRASEFRQGVKRWDLIAEQAEYEKVPERTFLKGVTLVVAGKPSVGTITFTSPQAEFMNASKNLLLPDGVSATGDRRLRFSAGPAVFSNASGLLTARGHVRYADDMLQVEGEEMLFATETRDLRLKRNVQATVHPQAAKR